jgi:hypothetical protein
MHGNGKLTKLTIPNQVQQETSYKLAAEKATALSWSDPNLMRINPHQTMTIKKKHIAAVQFNKNLKAVHATSHVLETQQCTHPMLPSWS